MSVYDGLVFTCTLVAHGIGHGNGSNRNNESSGAVLDRAILQMHISYLQDSAAFRLGLIYLHKHKYKDMPFPTLRYLARRLNIRGIRY